MTRSQSITCVILALAIGWFGKCVYDDYVVEQAKPTPADGTLLTPESTQSVLKESSGGDLTPLRQDAERTSPERPVPDPAFKVPAEPRGGYRRLPSGAVNDLRGS